MVEVDRSTPKHRILNAKAPPPHFLMRRRSFWQQKHKLSLNFIALISSHKAETSSKAIKIIIIGILLKIIRREQSKFLGGGGH